MMMENKLRPTILVVDDEWGVRESFKLLFKDEFDILEAEGGREAIELLKEKPVDLILLDILMPIVDGMEVLRKVREMGLDTEVIMVTALSEISTAVTAMKMGAYDYITKPFNIEEVISIVKKAMEKRSLVREVNYLRSEVERYQMFEDIVGADSKMLELYSTIDKVARSDSTVLLQGESGTGKELVARAIHRRSLRKDRAFVVVNCAAIPSELLENEMFGHEKGAFTGAFSSKIGKFEIANTGTIFLDEINCLALNLQSKLLRVLQEREIERVGGLRTIKVDVRVIAASSRNLTDAVKDKAFKEELFYRLNVIPIHLPPLRERRADIPLLVKHFIAKYNVSLKKKIKGFSREAVDCLIAYDWPGNIRELENLIERVITLCDNRVIGVNDLPIEILLPNKGHLREDMPLKKVQMQFERQYLLTIMERTNWNQSKAARLLGIHRNTLLLKLNHLGLRKRN